MKNNLTFAFILSCTCITMAQLPSTRTNDGSINLLTSDDRFQYINPFDGRSVAMRGTPYFLDSLYRPGELQTTRKLYTTELLYRFDQTQRMVQIKTENGKELWLNELDVVYFKLFFGEKSVYFISAAVPNSRKKTLLQVIYKSPTMQLLRDSRKYIYRVKSENLDGYSSELVYDEARKDYRYFFNEGEGRIFKEVKINAKSFSNLMPKNRAQITKLFKKAEQTKEGLTITKLAEILKELDKKADATQ